MKIIGIYLLVIAGIIILGLSSYWRFENWKVLDWIIIIFNIIAGIYLIVLKEEK